jgi:hypothetical protein
MQVILPGIGPVSFNGIRNSTDVYRSPFMKNVYADCVHCLIRPYQHSRVISLDIVNNPDFSRVIMGPVYPVENGRELDAVMMFGFKDETQAVLFKLTYP